MTTRKPEPSIIGKVIAVIIIISLIPYLAWITHKVMSQINTSYPNFGRRKSFIKIEKG